MADPCNKTTIEPAGENPAVGSAQPDDVPAAAAIRRGAPASQTAVFVDGCMWCRWADHPAGPECPVHQRKLSGEECTILAFGKTNGGALADPIADATMEWCEELVRLLLLRRGPPIGYIRTYFTTDAGADALSYQTGG